MTNHPIAFVFSLTIVWFVLALVITFIASGAFRRPYGDALSATAGRLAVTAGLLLVAWRLGWLEESGITRLGRWTVWMVAISGMVYFTGASLYSFYGKTAFDYSSLIRLPAARTAVLVHFVAGLSEEILFRGVVLYALVRVWGHTRLGMIGCVAIASMLFAVMHATQIFTHSISLSVMRLLVLETFMISLWWAALVLFGGSIWPAVVLHFVVNAFVAVQGLSVPSAEPELIAYSRLLWFSIPLGILGIGLLLKAVPQLGKAAVG